MANSGRSTSRSRGSARAISAWSSSTRSMRHSPISAPASPMRKSRSPMPEAPAADAARLPGQFQEEQTMAGPLAGVQVLDFGRYIAGPYCAALLAEFGAGVIRIDKRGGSEDRFVGPVSEAGEGALFLQMNRNKRSLALDPTSAEG